MPQDLETLTKHELGDLTPDQLAELGLGLDYEPCYLDGQLTNQHQLDGTIEVHP